MITSLTVITKYCKHTTLCDLDKTDVVYMYRNAISLYFGVKIRALCTNCTCIVGVFDHVVKGRQPFAAGGHRTLGVSESPFAAGGCRCCSWPETTRFINVTNPGSCLDRYWDSQYIYVILKLSRIDVRARPILWSGCIGYKELQFLFYKVTHQYNCLECLYITFLKTPLIRPQTILIQITHAFDMTNGI